MDHRYIGEVCSVCHDPTCAGCEERAQEESAPQTTYPPWAASLFSNLAREEPCSCLEIGGDDKNCPVHGQLVEAEHVAR